MNRREFVKTGTGVLFLFAVMIPVASLGGDLSVGGDCAVVIAKDAGESVRFAAEEFVRYAKRLTGTELPVLPDGSPETPEKTVRISAAAGNGTDGFSVKVAENGVTLVGDTPRSAIYAVYEVLERFGGCVWCSKEFEFVPEGGGLVLPVGFEIRERAAFESREPFWYDVRSNDVFMAKMRCNVRLQMRTSERLGGDDYRFGERLGSCHTFNFLLPPAKYYKSHPEYYAMRDGKRVDSQPCLSNPEVLKIMTAAFLAQIRKDPTARYYGISQNDNRNFCQCPACVAIDEEEGSHAGTVIRFVNAVAEEVEKEFPRAIVETLAYEYSRRPPRTHPRRNVMPCLCSIECDFARPLSAPVPADYAYGDHTARGGDFCAPWIPGWRTQNPDFVADLRGWGAISKRLYVWDYMTCFTHYLYPFPNEGVLGANLRLFRDAGVSGVFEQGAQEGRHGDLQELKCWLVSKLLWNPGQDEGALVSRFVKAFYGAAAPEVTDYLALRREIAAKPLRLGIYEEVNCSRYADEWLERAAALWRRAEAKVADDPARLYNVRMGSLGVDYVRLRHATIADCRRFGCVDAAPDFARWRPVAKRFKELMAGAKGGPVEYAEVVSRRFDAEGMIDYLAEPGRTRIPRQASERAVRLTWTGFGSYGDDPAAEDGRALIVNPRHAVKCAQVPLCEVAYAKGEAHRMAYRVRLVPREGVEPSRAAFELGVIDPKTQTVVAKRGFTVAEAAGGYLWCETPPFVPSDDLVFYLAPAPYDPLRGSSAAESIHIDSVRITR